MGIVLSNNFKLNQELSCLKCNCFDSYTKNIQKEVYPINDNNINAQVTFEINDKTNSIFSNQMEKISFKNKFTKYLNDRKDSTLTNSSKLDLKILKILKIQSYIRGYLFRRKLKQKQQMIILKLKIIW